MSKENQKQIINTLMGVVAGGLTVYAMRKYVDVQYPSLTIMKDTLKGFSAPSAYGSIAVGGAGTVYEMDNARKRSLDDKHQVVAGMSAALLIGGAVSGLDPVVAPVPAVGMRYAPRNVMPRQMPVTTAGGYPNQPNGFARGSV